MSQAIRYIPTYTVADYQRWEGEWELWDGVPVAMSPAPTLRHQQTQFQLMKLIDSALSDAEGCHCQVVGGVDWRVSDLTVVRPDIVVICDKPKNDFLEDPPTLIAEILSPSTAGKDRVFKRDLYAAQGVKFYLIVDHEQAHIEALRLTGQGQGYEATTLDTLDLHDGCTVQLNAGTIFST